jgi:hypothetical protein
MSNDRDLVSRALDLQVRARDYALITLPGYMEWFRQGESPAFIDHLDAMSMWLLPEDVSKVSNSDFEELLADLKEKIQK